MRIAVVGPGMVGTSIAYHLGRLAPHVGRLAAAEILYDSTTLDLCRYRPSRRNLPDAARSETVRDHRPYASDKTGEATHGD